MTRPDRILIVSHETTDDRTRLGPERWEIRGGLRPK